jgi:hypothetical protein
VVRTGRPTLISCCSASVRPSRLGCHLQSHTTKHSEVLLVFHAPAGRQVAHRFLQQLVK